MNEHATPQQVALTTGANKGTGRASAGQLAALGTAVLVGARDPRRGQEAAAAVRAAGGDAHAVTLEATDPTPSSRPRGGSSSASAALTCCQRRRRRWLRAGLAPGRPRPGPELGRAGGGPGGVRGQRRGVVAVTNAMLPTTLQGEAS
jgi:NAD(P)-dependent dehydrogenase (short-subunit alcohol dehydrogenase family)